MSLHTNNMLRYNLQLVFMVLIILCWGNKRSAVARPAEAELSHKEEAL